MTDFPPHYIALVDQGYAAAAERLDALVKQLAGDIRSRPDTTDALPWAASVFTLLQAQQELGPIHWFWLELWQAALYKLARQEAVDGSHG